MLVVQWKYSPSLSEWLWMIHGKLMMETVVERLVVRVRW